MPAVERLRERLSEVDAEIARIDAAHRDRQFGEAAREDWNALNAERDELRVSIDETTKRMNRLAELASNASATERATGEVTLIGKTDEDPWVRRSGSPVERAREAVDVLHRTAGLPDYAAERATALVDQGSETERSLAARWALAAGDPAYVSAFGKLLSDPIRGHMLWSKREQAAFQRAHEVRAAMGTGAGAGGEMIPLTLDPAIMLTSDGSINPLRQIARVVQTTTNMWQGVTSAGATAEWKAEHAQAADGSPGVDDEEIEVHLGDVDVTYSYEVGMDASNFLGELRRVILDAADQLQATAFTVGSGVGQPAGVITGAANVINTAGVFAAPNVVALQNALPARFSARAQWAGHIAVINAVGSFETPNGNLRFPEVANGQLLRKPLNELSNMSSDITTTSSKFLLYGDFFAGFVIADRVGATLEILPGYGANQRPTAQRHAFLTFRTGSKVVVPQAFRLLNKTAS
jgi:HK97 family phage major capsid protein